MLKFSNKNDIYNKQINFLKNLEGIDFNILNKSTEVNNYDNTNIIDNTKPKKDTVVINNTGTIKKNKILCPDCDNDSLVEEDTILGFFVCKLCGQVLEQMLDYNPEWKQYDDGDNNARCGGFINPLLPTSSIGTSIAGGFNNRMKIIHGWNSMQYKERSLNNEFKKIHEVCQKYNILKCIEDDAKIMYKNMSECKHEDGKNKGKFVITRGKNRISISAACLYFSCGKKGMTYTPKEIADMYDITYSEINKGIKNLRKLISGNKNTKNSLSHPSQFIKRYCNNLKILSCHTDEAVKVALNVEKLNVGTEHNPYSLAAACILIVAEKNKLRQITRKKLAAEFEISDVTINKTFKKIEAFKNIIFDKNKTELYSKSDTKEDDDEEIPQIVLEKMKEFGIDPVLCQMKKIIK
jgi:transcription initiation factor TFIIIB Brf1 subunit/transcription initiation factor TFIIB